MSLFDSFRTLQTRRNFFERGRNVMGYAALSSLLGEAFQQQALASAGKAPGPQFPAKAKRVIYLHMVGGPSQMDLFDYKPEMQKWYYKDLPASIRNGQRLTTMTSGQSRLPVAPSVFKFARHGTCGTWVSELLPHTAKWVDEIALV